MQGTGRSCESGGAGGCFFGGVGRVFREIKRPSVETEGRLTIACHMKNLQKIDVVFLQNRTKIKTEMQLNNTKWLKNCRLLNRFDMNLSFSHFSGCKIGDFSEKCKVFSGDFVFFFQNHFY